MYRVLIILIQIISVISSCRLNTQHDGDAIVIDSYGITMRDIYGESIRLKAAAKDSMLSILEANDLIGLDEVWIVIEKMIVPDQVLTLPLPEGFESDTVLYNNMEIESGRYFSIYICKSISEKEMLLASNSDEINDNGYRTIVFPYWDIIVLVNESKTEIVDVWIR